MMSAAATAATISDMNASEVNTSFSPPEKGNYYPLPPDFNGITG